MVHHFLTIPKHFWDKFVTFLTEYRHDCHVTTNEIIYCIKGLTKPLPKICININDKDFCLTGKDYLLNNNQLAIQS